MGESGREGGVDEEVENEDELDQLLRGTSSSLGPRLGTRVREHTGLAALARALAALAPRVALRGLLGSKG